MKKTKLPPHGVYFQKKPKIYGVYSVSVGNRPKFRHKISWKINKTFNMAKIENGK